MLMKRGTRNMILSLLAAGSSVSRYRSALAFRVVVPPRTFPVSSTTPDQPRFVPPHHRLSSSAVPPVTTSLSSSSSSFDHDRSRPFYVTTPIYYVNDKPHIGHAYTSTACDVLARFHRLLGRRVYFLSGTDEHGQKVETSAQNRGLSPQDFVDEVSVNFRELLDRMNISHDYFVRTTDEAHKEAVRHLWKTLVDKGAIYLGSYEGWYSVRDECYYNESELVDGKAPTGAEVEWVTKEPSYFFKLSEYQDRLLQHYEDNPHFIAPESRRNEVISFVKGGLRDLSVSRTSFRWGVPVPDDPDHVMYVWIDALANYLSALGYPSEESEYPTFWKDGTSCHVVGKDILRFHAVYWPAFLMAAGLPLPKRLFAHGWWTKDGEKISKSLGNVIDPVELCEKYGVDQTRFFLMADVTFGSDGDFSNDAMIRRVNSNLANELGNLCQRTLTLVYKNCQQRVPTLSSSSSVTPPNYDDLDLALLDRARSLLPLVSSHVVDEQALHKYAAALVSTVWEANKYIDATEPWTLKKKGETERMEVVLYVLMEVLRRVAILYQPIIPDAANRMLDQLGVARDERTFAHLESGKIEYGMEISKPQPVFPRIEVEEVVKA